MFGYIQPERDELRFREYAEYRAYYCGLCRCMGSLYGEAARAALSYDCTFIALLLSAMAGRTEAVKAFCIYKPLERGRMAAVADRYLEFAADLNILLYFCKLQDDWRDERRAKALMGKALMRGAALRAKDRSPALHSAVADGISDVSKIENANSDELDAAADAFARMMRMIAAAAPVEGAGNGLAFQKLMFHLGRWVYLIDAWEDREKDEKKGAYNPFVSSGAGRERAEFLLNCSLNEAINAYQLIELQAHESLLDNIMLEGCPAKNIQVLGGKDDKPV